MLYRLLIKPVLLSLKKETARNIILWTLTHAGKIPGMVRLAGLIYKKDAPGLRRRVFDMDFDSPIGMAAGFDRNGKAFNELSALGFSFITIGPVSASPDKDGEGVRKTIDNIRRRKTRTILAAELARSPHDSSESDIIRDFSVSFSLLYDFADMFVVSVGGPDIDILPEILDELISLRLCYESYKSIIVKLTPEVDSVQFEGILHFSRLSGIDGILAETPEFGKTLELVRNINISAEGSIPVIAGGDISDESRAAELLQAGASLIQIGPEMWEKGPGYVKRILKKLINV